MISGSQKGEEEEEEKGWMDGWMKDGFNGGRNSRDVRAKGISCVDYADGVNKKVGEK